nr:hypothetical protein [Tanacetum cinerariifolium]
ELRLTEVGCLWFLGAPYPWSPLWVLVVPHPVVGLKDNDSQREEINIITSTDDVLSPGVENDDSDREVDAIDDLRIDNSISNSEHEFSKSEESDFDNPSWDGTFMIFPLSD